jgi:hypothetical protein
MRYFPDRARKKDIGRQLKICTYCLGDIFTNGRCVQCNTRTNSIVPLLERAAALNQPSVFQNPAVN